MRKNLDISKEAVVALTIEGAKQNPSKVFKLYAEQILEDAAKPLMALQKPKSARAKSKK
jgi:hypothetical protein